MNRALAPRVRGLSALIGAGLIGALAAGRPELAILMLPFALLLGAGLSQAGEPRLSARLALERPRILEGQPVGAELELRNDGQRSVELELEISATERLLLEPRGPLLLRLGAGSRERIELSISAQRWGAHRIGPVAVRARDPLGLVVWTGRIGSPASLRVFPRQQLLRELVAPLQTQPFLGTHVARARGDGIEFADVRQFAPGDRVRQINWRVTARRGALHVTERHPEYASDVVLLLDTFEEARDAGAGTLDDAVRLTASLAQAFLARRDRVALVDFGGTLTWLEPAFGTRQLYRIIDSLLASQIAFSYAWRGAASIPARVLPPAALIVALTPLLDERSLHLLLDLRSRGRDLTVIEVSPLSFVQAGPSSADQLAHRLWRLQRDAVRSRLRALGVAVGVWSSEIPLAPVLEEVSAFRRSARPMLRA
ncbi:MAG: DUF58 domain-containing protein [Solirubrobacteraceae bacterium]